MNTAKQHVSIQVIVSYDPNASHEQTVINDVAGALAAANLQHGAKVVVVGKDLRR